MKYKSGLIHRNTILNAIHKKSKNNSLTTPEIRELLLIPQGYDLGGRLYGISNAGFLKKTSKNSRNSYGVTKAGIKAYQTQPQHIQVPGQYDLEGHIAGEGGSVQQIMGGGYSPIADQAMSELAGIIEKNTRLKGIMAGIVNQIDIAIGESPL